MNFESQNSQTQFISGQIDKDKDLMYHSEVSLFNVKLIQKLNSMIQQNPICDLKPINKDHTEQDIRSNPLDILKEYAAILVENTKTLLNQVKVLFEELQSNILDNDIKDNKSLLEDENEDKNENQSLKSIREDNCNYNPYLSMVEYLFGCVRHTYEIYLESQKKNLIERQNQLRSYCHSIKQKLYQFFPDNQLKHRLNQYDCQTFRLLSVQNHEYTPPRLFEVKEEDLLRFKQNNILQKPDFNQDSEMSQTVAQLMASKKRKSSCCFNQFLIDPSDIKVKQNPSALLSFKPAKDDEEVLNVVMQNSKYNYDNIVSYKSIDVNDDQQPQQPNYLTTQYSTQKPIMDEEPHEKPKTSDIITRLTKRTSEMQLQVKQ